MAAPSEHSNDLRKRDLAWMLPVYFMVVFAPLVVMAVLLLLWPTVGPLWLVVGGVAQFAWIEEFLP